MRWSSASKFLFWLIVASGVFALGVRHGQSDKLVEVALEDALREKIQLQAMVKLRERNGGVMQVHLANIPASDLAYEIVAIPRLQ